MKNNKKVLCPNCGCNPEAEPYCMEPTHCPICGMNLSGKIALGVGYCFIVVSINDINNINLKKSDITVKVNNVAYPIYFGKDYKDSTKIDKIMDAHLDKELRIKDYKIN